MDIAILLAGLRFDSQKKMVNGILENALQDDSNVYIFTCDIKTEATQKHNDGEHEIFSLVKFDSFDGVILHGDSIRDSELIESLAIKMNEAKIPAVSFNKKYEGMLYVGLENFNGIYKIVNHLIQDHGAKKLNFIAGPTMSIDAQERLQAYKCALEENGIPFEENRVYYGDWLSESGEAAVLSFIEKDVNLPDAIVAANDEMALGAFYALEEKGYNVPEQVLLTGYDNASISRFHYPRLTSVKRPEVEIGKEAYNMLKARLEGCETENTKEFVCEPVYADTCGCQEKNPEDTKVLRRRYVKEKMHMSTYSNIVRFSAADFTGVETYEQLFETIKTYASIMKLGEFYLCMCEEEQDVSDENSFGAGLDTVRKSYTDKMHIPILYREGQFSSYDSYDKDDLLPREFTEGKKGNYYTIIPLHFQEYCYGYFVLCNNRLLIDSDIFQLFIININNALENIRQKRLLNKMIDRLNRVWVYDALTGVFNRAGLQKFASAVIREAQNRKKAVFIVFLDLDGLKIVNDQQGHDEGDKYIKAMAEVLSKVRHHGELLVRYGGDEFVVIAQGDMEQDAKMYIQRIYAGIDEYNQMSTENFKLQASIGYTMVDVTREVDINRAIDLADQEMYKVKKEKKKRVAGLKK